MTTIEARIATQAKRATGRARRQFALQTLPQGVDFHTPETSRQQRKTAYGFFPDSMESAPVDGRLPGSSA